jgi:hypothetical protein
MSSALAEHPHGACGSNPHHALSALARASQRSSPPPRASRRPRVIPAPPRRRRGALVTTKPPTAARIAPTPSFQLHRVVVAALCEGCAGGTLHSWALRNPLNDAADAGADDEEPPTIALAHYEEPPPFLAYRQRLGFDGAAWLEHLAFPRGGAAFADCARTRQCACEHRVAACAVLNRIGATVRLEDGFTRYSFMTVEQTDVVHATRARDHHHSTVCISSHTSLRTIHQQQSDVNLPNETHFLLSRPRVMLPRHVFSRKTPYLLSCTRTT